MACLASGEKLFLLMTRVKTENTLPRVEGFKPYMDRIPDPAKKQGDLQRMTETLA